MKLLHYIPAYREQITTRLMAQMMIDYGELNTRGLGYMPFWIDSSDLPGSRNKALAHAIEHGWDYLVMQDSDIYCPAGSPLTKMLDTMEEHGADVVGAICGLRRIKKESIAPNVSPFNPGEVYEARRVGTGLILIDVKKLQKTLADYEGPWFARTYHDKRQTSLDFGEDFFFCKVIQAHSGKIVVDGRVETVHAYTDHVHLHYAPEAVNGDDSLKSEET